MTKDEMKNKCEERTRIFQQAMESCKSSNPIDCIEWFADKIIELEKENAEAKNLIEELAFSLSVVGECDEEECELINKAQKFINKPIF